MTLKGKKNKVELCSKLILKKTYDKVNWHFYIKYWRKKLLVINVVIGLSRLCGVTK